MKQVVKVGPRWVSGYGDVYGTGTKRIRFFYPAFGLYKWSLRSDSAGDVLGNKVSLFGGRRWKPSASSVLDRVLFASRPACWETGCHERAFSMGSNAHPLLLPACTPYLWSRNLTPATGLADGR